MKVIWAPWRMEYILGDKGGDCFLCDAAQAEPGPGSLVLYRNQSALAVMNRYPYNNGHLMVAPVWHTSDLGELPQEHYREVMELFRFSISVLEKSMAPEGFNAGLNLGKSAGAGLAEHLHWHIVPRWNGDTNFMPVIADTRVIPEALARTCEALRPLFDGYEAWRKEKGL